MDDISIDEAPEPSVGDAPEPSVDEAPEPSVGDAPEPSLDEAPPSVEEAPFVFDVSVFDSISTVVLEAVLDLVVELDFVIDVELDEDATIDVLVVDSIFRLHILTPIQ